jgi:hypothetical protein
MKKIRVMVVAEFEVPDSVVVHDTVFEAEGVFLSGTKSNKAY